MAEGLAGRADGSTVSGVARAAEPLGTTGFESARPDGRPMPGPGHAAVLERLSVDERTVWDDLVAGIGDGATPECDCHYGVALESAPGIFVAKLTRCHELAAWVAIWTDSRDGAMRTLACERHYAQLEAGERLYDSRRKVVRDLEWIRL